MNREEAVKVFEEIKLNYDADPDWGVYDGVFSRRNLTEILDAYTALRGPQPDPITGLAPCGCGGKAILEKGINYHSGYYVICEKCECNIGLDRDDFLRPFGAYPTAEQAVSDWNRAIGWKGGAE